MSQYQVAHLVESLDESVQRYKAVQNVIEIENQALECARANEDGESKMLRSWQIYRSGPCFAGFWLVLSMRG